MAKYIKREFSNLNHAEGKKVYYKLSPFRNIPFDEFVEKMCWPGRGIQRGEVTKVLTCLTESLEEWLSMGYTVKIDGLGHFSLSLGAKKGMEAGAYESEHPATNTKSIHVRGVNFRASKELVKNIDAKCDLERKGEQAIRRLGTTTEQRLDIARQLANQNGYFRIRDYAARTGLSVTAAGAELKAFDHDPSTGIMREGRGNTLVYTLRKKE